MDKERAADLLLNLLERARTSEEKIFLTSREISALALLLGVDEPAKPLRELTPQAGPLLKSLVVQDNEIDPDMMLCIDFGTSFSKAFASIETAKAIPEIIDLPIGELGGGSSELVTPSEMIIDDGHIHFGVQARKLFDDYELTPQRLIDSIKQ